MLYLLVIRYYDILFKIGDLVVVLVVVVMLVILCHKRILICGHVMDTKDTVCLASSNVLDGGMILTE